MKKIVPAINKMDKIFNYLYLTERATQSQISKKLNISKATTNRLVYSLLQLGYIVQHGREYSLGNRFEYFSNKNHNILKNISYPHLENLSLKFKETFKLSVLDKDKIRVIASVESSDYDRITVPENAIFPLHAGAASKLLICQLSDKRLNSLLSETLSKYTNNTITNKDDLKKELFKINIKKISYDNMEHSNKISAVAVPIYNKNKIIAALSCPYFSDNIDEIHIHNIVIDMIEAGKKITELYFIE